jgi:hypothetical protein
MNVLREHITVIPIPVAQIMRLVIAVHVTQDLPEMDSTAVTLMNAMTRHHAI